MIFILTGCLAFVFFYIFDLNKVKFLKKGINISFAAGIALLAVSTAGILLGDYKGFEVSIPLKLLFGALSIGSLFMIFYALFAALPYGVTYKEVEHGNTVVDSGMYALCRHPGVIWFFFFYLFLWLASGKTMMMWAGIIWTIMDIIYVYVEDRWFFPAALNGYDQYKSKVPFLIPNPASIKKCITFKQGDLR
jgi:protein-S-isoprenylcysteine O-methyltransferase Ste14